ncbi:MAG: thiopurine S-methyltransferase [Kiritimatiellia bacterium]|jgi:thiopurine S-methyltransferase
MKSEFWHSAWSAGRRGFHRDSVHPVLEARFDAWIEGSNGKVLVPLCGKTLDMAWMCARGASVVGVEIVERAVRELYDDMGVQARIEEVDPFSRWCTPGLDVWVGSIFDLSPEQVQVDRVWDRAALVALSPDQRESYVQTLISVLPVGGSILLVTLEYEPTARNPPPHSVPESVVRELYAGHDVTKHERVALPVGNLGMQSTVWRTTYEIVVC